MEFKKVFFSWPSIHKTTRFNPNSTAKKIKSKLLVNNSIFLDQSHNGTRLPWAVSAASYILACPDKTLSSKSFLPKNLPVRSGTSSGCSLNCTCISFAGRVSVNTEALQLSRRVVDWFCLRFFFFHHDSIFTRLGITSRRKDWWQSKEQSGLLFSPLHLERKRSTYYSQQQKNPLELFSRGRLSGNTGFTVRITRLHSVFPDKLLFHGKALAIFWREGEKK